MKRAMAAALALCLLLAGCDAGTPASGSGERANIEGIRDRVASTVQMITKVNDTIDWQIENSEKSIEEADAARRNGETYTPADNTEEVRQKQAELTGFLETVTAYSDWASSVSHS